MGVLIDLLKFYGFYRESSPTSLHPTKSRSVAIQSRERYIEYRNSTILPIITNNLTPPNPRPTNQLIPRNMHITTLKMHCKRIRDQLCLSTFQISTDTTHVVNTIYIVIVACSSGCFEVVSCCEDGGILDLGYE